MICTLVFGFSLTSASLAGLVCFVGIYCCMGVFWLLQVPCYCVVCGWVLWFGWIVGCLRAALFVWWLVCVVLRGVV